MTIACFFGVIKNLKLFQRFLSTAISDKLTAPEHVVFFPMKGQIDPKNQTKDRIKNKTRQIAAK